MTGPPFFSLMSRFCVDFTDRRAGVWRMRNERFAEVCIAEHDCYGGGSVIVWAEISAQGKTDLHVIDNGTLMAERYINEILDVHVRPYAGAIGPDFILMDDNARAHRALITNRYLEQAATVRLDWPARSRFKSHRTCMGYAAEGHFFSPGPTSNCPGAQRGSHWGVSPASSA